MGTAISALPAAAATGSQQIPVNASGTTKRITVGGIVTLATAAVPWTAPGAIGSVTPASGSFTDLVVSGRIIAAESADYTTGGYLFGESGNDTGWTSPSDGVMYQYGNSNIGSKWDSNGLSEMRGIACLFPNVQGTVGQVLTNDGSGVLSWATPTTGSFTTWAGFDGSGNLYSVPGWGFDGSHGNGSQYSNTYDVFLGGGGFVTHSYNNQYNPSANTVNINWGQVQYLVGIGTDDSGFNVDADGSGSFQQMSLYIDASHKTSMGDVGQFALSANFGNGIDAWTGKRMRGISLFNTFDNASHVENADAFQIGYNFNAGSVVDNYVGWADTTQISGTVGNYTGFIIGQGTQAHVTNNATLLQPDGDWTLIDGDMRMVNCNTHGGTVTGDVFCYIAGNNWTNVGGFFFLEENTNISGTQLNNYIGWNHHPSIATSHGYFGAAFSPNITTLTGGNATVVNINPNIDAAAGEDVTGLSINMSQSSSVSGQIRALSVQGTSEFEGRFSTNTAYTIADTGGSPSGVTTFLTNMTLGAGLTVNNADSFAVAPTTFYALDAGATANEGALGVGLNALGFLALCNIGAGATLGVGGGCFAGLVGLAGSGVINNGYGYHAIQANFGTTITVTNFKAYYYDTPAGAWATNEWGLYSKPAAAQNFIGGPLKQGGADTVTNASCGIELDSLALRCANIDTTARNALTALNGMVIYNTTTDKLQVYAAATWVDLH